MTAWYASHSARMGVAQGMQPAMAALGAGLVVASLAVGDLRSLVFGIDTHDAAGFTVAAVLLLIVTLAACLGPALRASRVDPAVASRSE